MTSPPTLGDSDIGIIAKGFEGKVQADVTASSAAAQAAAEPDIIEEEAEELAEAQDMSAILGFSSFTSTYRDASTRRAAATRHALDQGLDQEHDQSRKRKWNATIPASSSNAVPVGAGRSSQHGTKESAQQQQQQQEEQQLLLKKTLSELTPSDLALLRAGVPTGDVPGDVVYFLPSFLEDPWAALR